MSYTPRALDFVLGNRVNNLTVNNAWDLIRVFRSALAHTRASTEPALLMKPQKLLLSFGRKSSQPR